MGVQSALWILLYSDSSMCLPEGFYKLLVSINFGIGFLGYGIFGTMDVCGNILDNVEISLDDQIMSFEYVNVAEGYIDGCQVCASEVIFLILFEQPLLGQYRTPIYVGTRYRVYQ